MRLPSGQRYWTVLDEDLQPVAVADGFLRYQRFGRDGAESTTKAYAHAIVGFPPWTGHRSMLLLGCPEAPRTLPVMHTR